MLTLAGPGAISALGQAQISGQLSSATAAPNGSATLRLFLSNASNVRAYQTRISITRTSGTGTVSVTCPGGISIDQARADYLFLGQSGQFPAINCPQLLAACSLLSGGVSTGGGQKYLSEYTLSVSNDAISGSTFEMAILAAPASALIDSSSNAIPFTVAAPTVLTIVGPKLTFVSDICSECVRAPGTAQVALKVSQLTSAINGVQALFAYNPSVMTLSSVTPGDGAGSPWDPAMIVAVQDNAGIATVALVLNGGQSIADATVATLHFTAAGSGTTDVNFRPDDPPQFTKVTVASNNSTILPAKEGSGSIIVGTRSKGDVNGDGLRNGDDVQSFVVVLFSPGTAPPAERCAADMSGDGNVQPIPDVPLFIDCLLTGNCTCP